MTTCLLGNNIRASARQSAVPRGTILVARALITPRDCRSPRVDNVAVEALEEVYAAPESNLLSPLWDAYNANLQAHPLITKCFTSCIGFAVGDVTAQALTGGGADFDPVRCLLLASYGFIIDAPAGNAFYNWLDATIYPEQSKSVQAVAAKIAVDQLAYAPIFTCVLYAWLAAWHGNIDGIPEVLQEKVLPTLLANYAVWPLAHGLNFYFVPTEQRILYNNFVGVCWTTWLSCLAH